MKRLARIQIFPIKSFDPVILEEARVLPNGALEHDRQFALYDQAGRFVTGKRTAKVHRIESHCDPVARQVSLLWWDTGQANAFRLDEDRSALEEWLSGRLGMPVRLMENARGGFPDDPQAPGPTVMSTATLETVAAWFPGLGVNEVRRRFRANLEIDGVEAFWEDRLYGEEGEAVRFRVGEVTFEGLNPCARCVVPTRESTTGEADPQFAAAFVRQRAAGLPQWATRSRFDHFYRLAVNTRLSPVNSGGVVRVGDEVEVIS